MEATNKMCKKYEMLPEYIEHNGKMLYKIKALKDFGNVKAGDLGGYVESEENLSHEGDCWVYEKAKVFSNAHVYDNAQVSDKAQVYGYSHVYGDAQVSDKARVYDNARVYGDARVCGDTQVYGHTWMWICSHKASSKDVQLP